VSDETNIFTFVSCGKPPSRGFAFEELINVFDVKIWLLIFVFIVLIAFIIGMVFTIRDSSLHPKRMWVLEKHLSILMQVIKALLEQGDPFASTVIDNVVLRCSIGTFLLVGIVLSNAYKNSNVYNLVSPLKPIPYENLSQLLTDGF